jgi:hypothetical protein
MDPLYKKDIRADLITRAKLAAMVKRHMPDSKLLENKVISMEQVIDFFHEINRVRNDSVLEYVMP